MRLEWFVAWRYLRPRRGRGVISIVAAIAIAGFAAGVAALILALAVMSGFRRALQHELVGATAQVNLLRRRPVSFGNYQRLLARLARLPHVTALAPAIYDQGFISYGNHAAQVTLKGVRPRQEIRVGSLLADLRQGSWRPLERHPNRHALLLGRALAHTLGVGLGDWVNIYIPNAVLTPLGYAGRTVSFQVAGIFHSGFSDFDSGWAYASLRAVQSLHPGDLSGNRISAIEFKLDNIYAADQVARAAENVAGPRFTAVTWMAQNRAVFQALKLERLGTFLLISLIVFVAGLNILILLTMLVMEKRKEIAILMGLGARQRQIRRIFIAQGMALDLAGTGLGLALGYSLAWAANRFHWIPISASVYSISYVPFHPGWSDAIPVTILSLGVGLLATLYPAQRAVRVPPAETLRYE